MDHNTDVPILNPDAHNPTPPTHIATPQLIRIIADLQTRRRIFLHWCLFFFLVIILIVCSVIIPKPILELPFLNICNRDIGYNMTQLQTEVPICNPEQEAWIEQLYVPDLKTANQFLLVYGQFHVDLPPYVALTKINYTVNIYAIHENQKTLALKKVLVKNSTHYVTSNCEQDEVYQTQNNDHDDDDKDHDDDDKDHDDDDDRLRRFLQRQQQQGQARPGLNQVNCSEFVLAFDPILEFQNYLIVVNFTQSDFILKQIASRFQITFRTIVVSPKYTSSVLAIRYVFLAFSAIAALIFYFKMRKLQLRFWVIEQKFAALLTFLLFFFNDPLYAITALNPNRVTYIIGVVFFSNFVCCLVLYWLVLYDRIVNEQGQVKTKTMTKRKFVVCFFLWIFFMVTYILLVLGHFKDPSVSFEDLHQKAFMAFKLLQIILTIAILLYILRYLIQFCKCYESRLWRYKLTGLFNIFFMMCLGLFVISGSFELYNLVGTEVLICIGILNVYVYYQQYMWSPCAEGLEDQQVSQNIEMSHTVLNNDEYDQLGVDDIQINQPQIEEIDEKQNPALAE